MRYVVAGIIVLIALLQYRLWFAEGGMRDLWRLRDQVEQQQLEIEKLRQRNAILQAELVDLKDGLEAVEEIARSELGMIKEHETFFRVIRRPQDDRARGGDSGSRASQ